MNFNKETILPLVASIVVISLFATNAFNNHSANGNYIESLKNKGTQTSNTATTTSSSNDGKKETDLGVLTSPFLDMKVGREIVGVRGFSDAHKGIDYALIENIDYGTQVKLQSVADGTLYYGTWKAPEDASLVNWARKDYGGWGKFALLYADNGFIYIYAHLESVNKDLKGDGIDSVQKEVSRVLFPVKIWSKTIGFNFARDITIFKGKSVKKGDYIGDMGNIGFTHGTNRGDEKKTGKHLHFQAFSKYLVDVCSDKTCDKMYETFDPLKHGFEYSEDEGAAIKNYENYIASSSKK